jgi:hypothetical protein
MAMEHRRLVHMYERNLLSFLSHDFIIRDLCIYTMDQPDRVVIVFTKDKKPEQQQKRPKKKSGCACKIVCWHQAAGIHCADCGRPYDSNRNCLCGQ